MNVKFMTAVGLYNVPDVSESGHAFLTYLSPLLFAPCFTFLPLYRVARSHSTLLCICVATSVKRYLRHVCLIQSTCSNHLSSFLKMHYLLYMESNPVIAPLFARRSLWQCIEDGRKSKYCIGGDFCCQTCLVAK
jgi:hypothetical protein